MSWIKKEAINIIKRNSGCKFSYITQDEKSFKIGYRLLDEYVDDPSFNMLS